MELSSEGFARMEGKSFKSLGVKTWNIACMRNMDGIRMGMQLAVFECMELEFLQQLAAVGCTFVYKRCSGESSNSSRSPRYQK